MNNEKCPVINLAERKKEREKNGGFNNTAEKDFGRKNIPVEAPDSSGRTIFFLERLARKKLEKLDRAVDDLGHGFITMTKNRKYLKNRAGKLSGEILKLLSEIESRVKSLDDEAGELILGRRQAIIADGVDEATEKYSDRFERNGRERGVFNRLEGEALDVLSKLRSNCENYGVELEVD